MPRLRSRVRASFPAPNISLSNPRDSAGKRKGASAPFSFSAPEPSGETFLHLPLSIIVLPHVIYPVVLIQVSGEDDGEMHAILRPGRTAGGGRDHVSADDVRQRRAGGNWPSRSRRYAGHVGAHWRFFLRVRFSAGLFGGGHRGYRPSGIRRLRWFLLLYAILSAIAPGLLNADQRIFGTIAVLPGMLAGFLWWRRRLRDAPRDDVLRGTPSP